MPAHSRISSLYTHAAFELWKGRGMKSKQYRNMLLETGAVWLLLMLLQLLPCNTTEGPLFQGWQQGKEWGIMMIMMLGHICIHAANPKLFDLWLTQDRAYILRHLGKNSLWETYTHCSAWKCFIFLNIFVQCEEPDSWRPKIQSCHCVFLRADVCSHLRSSWPPNANYISRKSERKMSGFLFEISCEKWKLKQ